jgi:tetratricopeptide (TPR) repeat protein
MVVAPSKESLWMNLRRFFEMIHPDAQQRFPGRIMKRFSIFRHVLLAAFLLTGVAQGDDTNRAKAREYFTHAVALFDDKRFADSLEEFQRSYELAPVFSTLYNIGLVHVALGHPVEAVDAFDRYLAQGGGAVPADKRARVESELAVHPRFRSAPPWEEKRTGPLYTFS